MALWKAGANWNNNFVTSDNWKALSDANKVPFGQLPALELADGTVIAQSSTILKFIAD